MKFKLLISGLVVGMAMQAQVITDTDLKDIQASFKKDRETIAIQNILTTQANIRGLALNHDLQSEIDHYFKYRVNVSGITNQKSSGRCWMFTSMNVLRPSIMEKYNISTFDFSHNYLYFWDIFEKSNLFLENIISTAPKSMGDQAVVYLFKNPVSDGGVWNLYYNAAEKYGVVPTEVMPETAHSDNTSQMISLINERLRKGGYDIRKAVAMAATEKLMPGAKEDELRLIKMAALEDVYRILALCLGEPPTEFTWRYKDKAGDIQTLKSTPKDFYKAITPADYNPANYVMVMNDPTREFYKIYEIDNYKNTIEGINWIYLNLPNEDIKKATLASIKNNEAMYSSSDVGKQFNRESGILDPRMYDYYALLGVELNMDKKARILTRESGSSHAMLLMACDTDEKDNPTKWEFENSWGASAGNKGYLTFTDDWFNEYIFRLVINRKYLDAKAIDALKQKSILLPMWDYMN